MTHLTPMEINVLIHQVGAATLVAVAADVVETVNPIDWANGSKNPSETHMKRLVELNYCVDRLVSQLGGTMARGVLGADTSIVNDIRTGNFERARDTVQQHILNGGLRD